DQSSELAGQVRTHLEYLVELGVDSAEEFRGVAAKLNSKRSAVRAQSPAPGAPAPKERTIPAPMPPRPAAPPPQLAPAARLADLPRLGAPRSPGARSPIVTAGTRKPPASQPALGS